MYSHKPHTTGFVALRDHHVAHADPIAIADRLEIRTRRHLLSHTRERCCLSVL